MRRYVWQPQYAAAILALVPSHSLISEAENAISARLQDSPSGNSISPGELSEAKYALSQLRRLKRQVDGQSPSS